RAQTGPPGGVPDPGWSTSDQGQFAGDIPPGFARIRAPFVEPRIETTSTERPIAPGVTLRSFDRYGPDGYTGTPTWLQADSLTVDLTKGTTVDYLFPGRVAAGEPISVQASKAGAVAAVNGDFFDINNSNAPLGTGIRSGTPVQSHDATDATWHGSVATVSAEGVGSIGEVFFEGTIVFPDASTTPLAGINKPTLPADGIEAFTPQWGTYCRCRPTRDAAHVTEVEVVGGNVAAVRPQASEGEVPATGFVLVGREAGADRLATLKAGDPLRIDYRSRTPEDTRIQAAVSGRQLLVIDGQVQGGSDANNIPPAPRTAVGFSRDGTTMFLLTADGRQPAFSDGLGLNELGEMMAELGAYNALNLDGGGSTTIVA
ncbi:MAG: phosphodiester glycosidase family protein, partial [Nocardioidaceae bacterium]